MRNYKQTAKSGSSLVIALVLMAVLLILSLGVSELLIGSLGASRLLIEKTKAWYAAESALEQGLFAVSENPPGFEAQKQTSLGPPDVRYEYRVKAVSAEIPVKEPYEIRTDEDKYAVLHLNESATIPLFRGTAPEEAVKRFRVDYYLAPDLKMRGAFIDDDLDILRWKIFGFAADGALEVINEFLPANQGNSAESPTCLGTASNCYNAAKFYKRVQAADGATEFHIVERFPIETFLEEHSQNFLVLTNITNTDLVAGALSTEDKQKIADIRYRIAEQEGQPLFTLPEIKISADGFAGNAKQSLDIKVARDSFLPVFNYALYRTKESL